MKFKEAIEILNAIANGKGESIPSEKIEEAKKVSNDYLAKAEKEYMKEKFINKRNY